jgi:hypothetical protein
MIKKTLITVGLLALSSLAVLANESFQQNAARAAMAAHPITSKNPQIAQQQAREQEKDYLARMAQHDAEVEAVKAQQAAREAEAERARLAQAAREQADYEVQVATQQGRQDGESAANNNPNLKPEELELHAKTYWGSRTAPDPWNAYFNGYREAYNRKAPEVLVWQEAEAKRQAAAQAQFQERWAKVTGSRSNDPEAKQDSYQKGFQWGRNIASHASTSDGRPSSGMPTSVAKKIAPNYAMLCNPLAADYPSFERGLLDAIDQFEGLTPM